MLWVQYQEYCLGGNHADSESTVGLPRKLLHCLASLGHGDEIIVADANFPSHSTALETAFGKPIELPGMSATEAIELITQLMPLDDFVPFVRPAHGGGR